MNGFERRRERKRQDILHAARKLFFQDGYNKVSITRLAQTASVSQVTIYNLFNNKLELARQVAKDYLDGIIRQYESILEESLSFREKTEKILFLSKFSITEINQELYKVVNSRDTEMKNVIRKYAIERSIPVILQFIDQGKAEGFIDPELDDRLAILYVRAFIEIKNQPEVSEQWDSRQRTQIHNLFYYGLLGNNPT